MMYFAYYSEKKYRGEIFKRGESGIRITKLSKIFHWEVYTTHRFVHELHEQCLIEILRSKPFKWRIVDYDELCHANHPGKDRPEDDKEFIEFFTGYNEAIDRSDVDSEEAFRYWKRLSKKDKAAALSNYQTYIERVNDRNKIRTATNFLAKRSFILHDED